MCNPNERLRAGPWDKLVKRLAARAQGAVRSGSGNCAILHVTIIVNEAGNPVGWLKPQADRLEPKGPWLLEKTNLVERID